MVVKYATSTALFTSTAAMVAAAAVAAAAAADAAAAAGAGSELVKTLNSCQPAVLLLYGNGLEGEPQYTTATAAMNGARELQ